MGMLCPWCQSRMPYGASVCPHCTRSIEDWNRRIEERAMPRPQPPAHTLPCHGCGAFVPEHLFGHSRKGGRPGRCPACSCSLDTAYWDRRFQEGMKKWRRCGCGKGRCLPCGGSGKRAFRFLFFSIPIPCSTCEGSGRCQVCFDGEWTPEWVNEKFRTGRIRRPPEPVYTAFVPPPDWRLQCPVCGARVQHPVDVCWNCNFGAD